VLILILAIVAVACVGIKVAVESKSREALEVVSRIFCALTLLSLVVLFLELGYNIYLLWKMCH